MRQSEIWATALASLGLWTEEAPAVPEKQKMPVGGQAVIEGVLMKGNDRWGLAVRQPDGGIFKENWKNFFRPIRTRT